ncbi:hypothetical protein HMPREF0239_00602, partial [Clostridium sp. ATCC BAA-442]
SFSEGIILIMKSVVLRKFALMMKFLLKYQRIGVGQGWEVVWTFVMEHTTPLSMFLKASLL